MIYSIVGLILDLIGVLLLFKYGILPDNLWQHLLMDSGMSDADEKKHKIWSKIAMSFVFLGFSLQLIGTLIQSQKINTPKIETYANLDLGKDTNHTTGIVGHLKLKYENGNLFYQFEINGDLAYFEKLTNFTAELEDKDGFKISEINVDYTHRNKNLSMLIQNDKLILTAKGKVKFKSVDYLKIKKWNLTAYQN